MKKLTTILLAAILIVTGLIGCKKKTPPIVNNGTGKNPASVTVSPAKAQTDIGKVTKINFNAAMPALPHPKLMGYIRAKDFHNMLSPKQVGAWQNLAHIFLTEVQGKLDPNDFAPGQPGGLFFWNPSAFLQNNTVPPIVAILALKDNSLTLNRLKIKLASDQKPNGKVTLTQIEPNLYALISQPALTWAEQPVLKKMNDFLKTPLDGEVDLYIDLKPAWDVALPIARARIQKDIEKTTGSRVDNIDVLTSKSSATQALGKTANIILDEIEELPWIKMIATLNGPHLDWTIQLGRKNGANTVQPTDSIVGYLPLSMIRGEVFQGDVSKITGYASKLFNPLLQALSSSEWKYVSNINMDYKQLNNVIHSAFSLDVQNVTDGPLPLKVDMHVIMKMQNSQEFIKALVKYHADVLKATSHQLNLGIDFQWVANQIEGVTVYSPQIKYPMEDEGKSAMIRRNALFRHIERILAIAAVDQFLVVTLNGDMAGLIKRIKSKAQTYPALTAASLLPSYGYRMDLALGDILKMMLQSEMSRSSDSSAHAQEMQAYFQRLKDAKIYSAMDAQPGYFVWRMRTPTDWIGDTINLILKDIQENAVQPQPVPPAISAPFDPKRYPLHPPKAI